jgi:hypothetical protein
MNMQDFPAAHSMDTTWFAIDADGCVGIFNSDENGAVPKDLTGFTSETIDFKYELADILMKDKRGVVQNVKSVEIEAVTQDISVNYLIREIRLLEKLNGYNVKHLILHLSNEQVLENLKLQASVIIRFMDEKIIVYVDRCDRDWLKQAIKLRMVLAGKEARLELNLSWLGWYEYSPDGYQVNPYDRNYLLKEPIYFDDLSPAMIDRLNITELPNVRFSETRSIQPIEHMPCQTWGGSENWIDTNGVEHDRFPEYPNLDRAND